MSWTPNPPEKRIEYLERRVAELERAIEHLQGKSPWMTLGDSVKPWRRDMTAPAMPIPQPPPMFRPAAGSQSWDVGTAFRAGLASGCMAAMLSMTVTLPGLVPWYSPLIMFFAVGPITFYAVSVWPKSVMSMLEKQTGIDLDGNGQIGEPPPQAPERLEIEVTERNEKGSVTGIKLLDMLNIPAVLLREFAAAAVAGDSLTVARWTGASGKFSQPQYQAMMAELERAGLVEPGRGNQGRSLTHAGRAVLRRIAG